MAKQIKEQKIEKLPNGITCVKQRRQFELEKYDRSHAPVTFRDKKVASKEEIKENQIKRLDQVTRYNLEKEKEKINNNSNSYSFIGTIKTKDTPRRAKVKESISFLVDIIELLNNSKNGNKQFNSVKENIKQYSIDSCVNYLDSRDIISKDKTELGTDSIIELNLEEFLNNPVLRDAEKTYSVDLVNSLTKELEKNPDTKEKMHNKAKSKISNSKKSAKKSGKKKTSKVTKKKVSKNGRKTK